MKGILTPAVTSKFAHQLFSRGTDYFSASQVKEAFGIEVDYIPPISFTEEELTRAQELGYMLTLEPGDSVDGYPLTMKGLCDLLNNKLGDGLLLNNLGFYKDQDFFLREPIASETRWRLVSKKPLDGLDHLVQHLQVIYPGKEMPRVYQEAIDEFLDLQNEPRRSSDKKPKHFKLNQLCCPTAGEVLYVISLDHAINGGCFLKTHYDISTMAEWAEPRPFGVGFSPVGCSIPIRTRSSVGNGRVIFARYTDSVDMSTNPPTNYEKETLPVLPSRDEMS